MITSRVQKLVILTLLALLLGYPCKSHAYVQESWHFNILPKDSIAAGATYTSPALKIRWEQAVEISFTNSLPSTFYTDSLTLVQVAVSSDSVNWSRPFELTAIHNAMGTITAIDSTGSAAVAVINDPIPANTAAINAQGPLAILLFPKLYGAALPAPEVGAFGIGSAYLRLQIKNISRGRGASACAACAAYLPVITITAFRQK